jgi:hypothetical protein
MYLGEKVMRKRCIKWFAQLPLKKRQWFWFVTLWMSGLLALSIISAIIKLLMFL